MTSNGLVSPKVIMIQKSDSLSKKVMNEWFKAAGAYGKPDVKTLERLLDEHKGKLDVNATDGGIGRTALGWAASCGHADVVEFLLARGADVNKYSSKNPSERPLWWAARLEHAKAVSALIAGGAEVNEATDYHAHGSTALHVAAEGLSAIARLLLESGADATIRHKNGKTAAELAVERKKGDVVAVFEEFASKSAAAARPAESKAEFKSPSPDAQAAVEKARADAEKQRTDKEAGRAAAFEAVLKERAEEYAMRIAAHKSRADAAEQAAAEAKRESKRQAEESAAKLAAEKTRADAAERALAEAKRETQRLAAELADTQARLKAALGEHKQLSLESAAAVLTEMKVGSQEFEQLQRHVLSRECLNGLIEDYVGRRLAKKLAPITFKLVGAQTVSNPLLEQRFRAAQARLAAATEPKRSEKELRVCVGFHGTHPRNLKPICDKGLLRVGHKLNGSHAVDEGFFGMPEFGVNLSRYLDYSLKYSNQQSPLEPGETCQLIMFNTLPGRSRHIKQRTAGLKPSDSPGHDSHSSSNFHEWYLFNEDQCCPTHVLTLQAVVHDRTAADDV